MEEILIHQQENKKVKEEKYDATQSIHRGDEIHPCKPGPDTASNPIERNKEIVKGFIRELMVNRDIEAAMDYVVEDYIQHNPLIPTGRKGLMEFFKKTFEENPDRHSICKRMIAEGDFVVVHHHARRNPDDRGEAVIDIFRIKDGKIIEHWNVIQAVPEHFANENGMF